MTGYKDIRNDGSIAYIGMDWSIPINPGCRRVETTIVHRRPNSIEEAIHHTSIVDLPAADRAKNAKKGSAK